MTIVVNGQIVKELENGSVPIPFGSEYKIRLRNKHNRRAICKLTIDGENVSAGGFIIPANDVIEIERPADIAKKFKFVSLDSEEAYDQGKNGPNYSKIKGVISADFALEKEYKPVINLGGYLPRAKYGGINKSYVSSSLNNTRGIEEKTSGEIKARGIPCCNTPDSFESLNWAGALMGECNNSHYTASYSAVAANINLTNVAPLQDGATVEGSASNQRFYSSYFNNEDEWTNVRLFLQGFNPSEIRQVETKVEVTTQFNGDHELLVLEAELLELRKLKMRKEIDQLKAELA